MEEQSIWMSFFIHITGCSFPYPSLHFHIATHRKARAKWNLNALENVAILILFQSIFVKSINAVVLINK